MIRPTLASLLVGALVAAVVPSSAQATQPEVRGSAKVMPAPSMPAPAALKQSTTKRAKPIAVPAAGNTASGVFDIYSGVGRQLSHTAIAMPAAEGVPLLADWNGDGIRTPGRYSLGHWYATDAVVDSPASWTLHATFGGQAGEIPVTGSVDGDGKVDVGVFRDGAWRWQLSGGGAVREESFGDPGDIPVVGDWNGDGRDEIGVFRQGSWILRLENVKKPPKTSKGVTVTMVPEASAAIVTFPFGISTDTPVVGDWNGDGKATVGVVRDGHAWVLSAGFDKLKRTKALEVPVPAGSTALVGTQATAADHCPTASPAAEANAMALAAKVRAPAKLTGTTVGRPGMAEIKATVQDGLRFAITNDYTKRLADDWRMPYYDVLSTHKSAEESVRRSANIAQAGAIMLSTSNWSTVHNISRSKLLDYTRWQIRSLACQHGALTPGGWGMQWQSALWATAVGHAGWMLWGQLSKQERANVAAMVAAEADAVAARGPHYYRDRAGVELAPGNSKADEVSWDLTAPALALAMMPTAKRSKAWKRAIVEYSIAAFSRPSDLTNNLVVNGVNVSASLPGTNANEDGTITNHGIINPDYIQNVVHPWWGASLLRVGRVAVPEAMFLNADIVYRALTVVQFPSPPYASPGGTVYQPGGQIYYPQGVKWGARRPATFTGVDSFAALYAAKDTKAKEYLAAHARDTRAMQQRYTDGHIYAKGTVEESYSLGKEEYALQQTALAWWASSLPTGPGLRLDKSAVKNVNLSPRGADR